MPNTTTITILDVPYSIEYCSPTEDRRLETCDGFCDFTTATIKITTDTEGATLEDMNGYLKKVLRHEIVHAFLFESGLGENSNSVEAWALNEEMVDWIARQGIKIYRAWVEADAV